MKVYKSAEDSNHGSKLNFLAISKGNTILILACLEINLQFIKQQMICHIESILPLVHLLLVFSDEINRCVGTVQVEMAQVKT